jgi:hypothetical protein
MSPIALSSTQECRTAVIPAKAGMAQERRTVVIPAKAGIQRLALCA